MISLLRKKKQKQPTNILYPAQFLCSLQSKQEPALLSLEEGVSHSCPFLGMSKILLLPVPVSWLYFPTPGPQEHLLLLQPLIQIQKERWNKN